MISVIDKLNGLLNTLIDNVVGFLPDLIGALLLFVLGLLFAKFVRWVLRKALLKIRINDFSEKIGLENILKRMKKDLLLSNLLSDIAYWIILMVLIMGVSTILGIEIISNQITMLIAYFPKLLIALVMVFIGYMIADKIRKVVYAAITTIGITGGKIISNILFYIIFVLVLINALEQAEINTSLITSNIILIMGSALLAFALAYSFASRDILTNVLSSFYLRGRYSEGETIRIGDVQGKILKIDSISVILQLTDKKVVIPSKRFISKEVEIIM